MNISWLLHAYHLHNSYVRALPNVVYIGKERLLVAKCVSSNKLSVLPLPICMRWSAIREINVHNQWLRSANIFSSSFSRGPSIMHRYILTGVMYRREYEWKILVAITDRYKRRRKCKAIWPTILIRYS